MIKSPFWVICYLWVILTFGLNLNVKIMLGDTKIKIQGHLDKQWEYMFNGMVISYEDNNTILIGHVKDDAYLHGVLNLIRDLNLKLISVNPLNEEN